MPAQQIEAEKWIPADRLLREVDGNEVIGSIASERVVERHQDRLQQSSVATVDRELSMTPYQFEMYKRIDAGRLGREVEGDVVVGRKPFAGIARLPKSLAEVMQRGIVERMVEFILSSTLRIFARVLDAGPEDCRFRNNARGLFDAGCHASEGAERNPSFLR